MGACDSRWGSTGGDGQPIIASISALGDGTRNDALFIPSYFSLLTFGSPRMPTRQIRPTEFNVSPHDPVLDRAADIPHDCSNVLG